MIDRALVTGASGAVGPTLVRHLVASGWCVRALVRHAPPPGVLPAEVDVVEGDIADRSRLMEAAAGMTTVFHLAARLHGPAADIPPREYYETNVEGTRSVTSVCRDTGIRRLVFFSTIAVYGPTTPPAVQSERSALRPDSVYARTKREAEDLVLDARSAAGEPFGVVLRLAAVYGPRLKGNYARLVRALRAGWFVAVGDGSNRRTLVYDEDVAAAAAIAARHPHAAGRVYNVTDGEIHTVRDILEAISRAVGRSSPRLHLPAGPLRALVGVCEDVTRPLGGIRGLNRAVIDKILEDVAVDGGLIQRELGFRPRVNLVEGWSKAVGAVHA